MSSQNIICSRIYYIVQFKVINLLNIKFNKFFHGIAKIINTDSSGLLRASADDAVLKFVWVVWIFFSSSDDVATAGLLMSLESIVESKRAIFLLKIKYRGKHNVINWASLREMESSGKFPQNYLCRETESSWKFVKVKVKPALQWHNLLF